RVGRAQLGLTGAIEKRRSASPRPPLPARALQLSAASSSGTSPLQQNGATSRRIEHHFSRPKFAALRDLRFSGRKPHRQTRHNPPSQLGRQTLAAPSSPKPAIQRL